VPHHAAEIIGWRSPAFWYFAAACAIGAALLVVVWPARDRGLWLAVRLTIASAVFVLGISPALIGADPRHPSQSTAALAAFARTWEPPGRDRIAKLRARALATGKTDPCLWHLLADLELSVGMFEEADRDGARAGIPASRCR
jgi:hypothetical protein